MNEQTLRNPTHLMMHHHRHQSASTDVVLGLSSSSSSNTSTALLSQQPPTSDTMRNKRDASSCSSLECQSLQSSIKRVKLSLSPGELRLQRDLDLLGQHGWVRDDTTNNTQRIDTAQHPRIPTTLAGGTTTTPTTEFPPGGNTPFTLSTDPSTWIHASTRARLSLVDSLRLCLFIPYGDDENDISEGLSSSPSCDGPTESKVLVCNSQSAGEHSHQHGGLYTHPHKLPLHQQQQATRHHHNNNSNNSNNLHCVHDTRRQIWIQFPRRYPHKPPVVSRIDGLAIERVVVNDSPPSSVSADGDDISGTRMTMTMMGGTCRSPSMARSQSTNDASSAQNAHQGMDLNRQRWGSGGGTLTSSHHSTNQSPEFGSTSISSSPLSPSSPMHQVCAGDTKTVVWNHWSPVVPLGEFLDFLLSLTQIPNMSAWEDVENESGRTSMSGSSSFPSLFQSAMSEVLHSTVNVGSSLFVDEQKMEDTNGNITPRTSNFEAELKPNRFDMGYAKADEGIGAGSAWSTTTSGSSNIADYCDWMNTEPFRDVKRNAYYDDDEDEDAMDL